MAHTPPGLPQTQTGSGLSFGWREYIGPHGNTQGGSFAPNASQITMTIDIAWADAALAVQEILGTVETVSNPAGSSGTGFGLWRIHRTLPWQHPKFPSLFATKISHIEGVKWSSKIPGGAALAPYSGYYLCRMTVLFETLPYDIRQDNIGSDQQKEWERYVTKHEKGSVQLVTTDKAQYVWGPIRPPGVPENQPLRVGLGRQVSKARLQWKWQRVPNKGLLSGGIAKKLLENLGKVNSAAFAGFPPGTLLFDGYDREPTMEPYSDVFVPGVTWDIPRTSTVTLDLLYFDPRPLGDEVRMFGHNLSMFSDGKWYPIQTSPEFGGGLPLYSNVDFAQLFEMHDPLS